MFKLGTQIGQTIRNAGRFQTIVGVFARHGFYEIVQRMNLKRYVPFSARKKGEDKEQTTIAKRLRLSFEELGPAFVKLGQLLSVRPDIVPPDWCQELKKLQDRVTPLEFSKIKPVVEKELKQPIAHVFKEFSEKAVAGASIAQVHLATLKNGTEVIVKVQRPGIEKPIKTDIQLLHILAGLLDKYVPESHPFNPIAIVKEFERSLTQELNFLIETNNMIRIKNNMKGLEDIVVPEVYKEFSTSKLLVQEKINGMRLSDTEKIHSQNIDIKKLTHLGIQAFYKQVLIDGLFHGDLHAGNLFVTSEGKLAVVDFGIVGHLTRATREALTNMFLCLLSEDYETLAFEFLDIGSQTGKVNVTQFQQDIKTILEPYYGMPLKDFNVGKVLLELVVCASKHHIQMSQDLMLVSKAILTIEGMGKEIDPDFDLVSEMAHFAKEIFKERYNLERLGKETIWIIKDLTSVVRVLPRYLKQLIRKQSSEDYTQRIEIENLEKTTKELSHSYRYQSNMIFCSSLVIASTLFIIYKTGPSLLGFSLLGFAGLGFSLLLALFIYLRS